MSRIFLFNSAPTTTKRSTMTAKAYLNTLDAVSDSREPRKVFHPPPTVPVYVTFHTTAYTRRYIFIIHILIKAGNFWCWLMQSCNCNMMSHVLRSVSVAQFFRNYYQWMHIYIYICIGIRMIQAHAREGKTTTAKIIDLLL